MGSLTNPAELKVLDSLFGASTTYSPPGSYYIGLSTTTIGEEPSNISEPSGNNYSRAGVSNNKTTWTNAAAGALSNAIQISFPQASGSWGTVVDFFLSDTSSGGSSGNYWGYGTLAVSKTIQSGDTASFAIGDIDVTLT